VVHCGPNGAATKAGALCETRDAAYKAGTSRAATSAHRTAYEYNALGETVLMKPPGGGGLGNQTYTYDGLSRLMSTTDGNGQMTTYGYDAMDRQTYVQHNDNSVEAYSFGATAANNGWLRSLTEYATPNGAVTRTTLYGRDDLGRTTTVQHPEGSTAYRYDPASNLTGYTDTGGTIAYGYNAGDQLTSLQMPGGDCSGLTYASPGAAASKCVLFDVDDDGRRTGTKYPGGTSNQVTTLDDSGRIKHIVAKSGATPGTRLDLVYSYTETVKDATGKDVTVDTDLVTAVTDAVTDKKISYSHDEADRLTVASTAPTGGGAVSTFERFCYDPAGNRTKYYTASTATCDTVSPAATYTYNTANQLTAATGVTPTGDTLSGSGFSYDANGNETAAKSAIGRTTTYGDRDQATSFTPDTTGYVINQSYSGTGNRERVKSGSTTFVNSDLAPAPAYSTTGTTSTWTVRDPKGKLIAVRIGTSATSTSDYYPFTDNLDNVRALVTATGSTPDVAYTYSAYGATTSTTGSLNQPYRYGGGYTDTSTGLIKLGVRYYDPVLGRYTQHDPTNQEQHPYAYSKGCPSTYNDPSGAISDLTCRFSGITTGFWAGTLAAGGGLGWAGSAIGTFTGNFTYSACLSKKTDAGAVAIDGVKAGAWGVLGP
jgi:RHS repeat-associated protein